MVSGLGGSSSVWALFAAAYGSMICSGLLPASLTERNIATKTTKGSLEPHGSISVYHDLVCTETKAVDDAAFGFAKIYVSPKIKRIWSFFYGSPQIS
jgi:hypothetical protein